jgi:hypothetical protein
MPAPGCHQIVRVGLQARSHNRGRGPDCWIETQNQFLWQRQHMQVAENLSMYGSAMARACHCIMVLSHAR